MSMNIRPNRNQRKQILIDEDTDLKIKYLSLRNNLSVNEIINRAIHSYIARSKYPDADQMQAYIRGEDIEV